MNKSQEKKVSFLAQEMCRLMAVNRATDKEGGCALIIALIIMLIDHGFDREMAQGFFMDTWDDFEPSLKQALDAQRTKAS